MTVARLATGLIVAAAAVALAGCSIGPTVLQSNRAQYNMAVQRSASEQLLLNMVRLKYREPTLFLQIGSISSHFNYTANASVGGTFPEGGPDTATAGLGGSVSEQPTLTYAPLEGKAFANRILTETDMGTFTLLVRGGWQVDALMRLVVERIGPMRNWPTVSGPGEPPTAYERFLELVTIWRERQRAGDLRFIRRSGEPVVVAADVAAEDVDLDAVMAADAAGYRLEPQDGGRYRLQKGGTASLVVEVAYASAEQADRADELLAAEPERTPLPRGRVLERIELVPTHEWSVAGAGEPGRRVPIQLRSYSDLLYYVAQGIDVPEGHVADGLTKIYRDPQGEPIDRRTLTRDLLDVRCAALPPAGAFVAVPYRGQWFYIADSDTASKDAFTLLSIVFALQSDEKPAGPVLTLPVSG